MGRGRLHAAGRKDGAMSRLALQLVGYPRLGGGGFHIAHLLWGGLLMLAAIVLLLGFLTLRIVADAERILRERPSPERSAPDGHR